MPHNRQKRERQVRDKYEFLVFGGEYSVFNAALVVLDSIITGGSFSASYLQKEMRQFGIDLPTAMATANPPVNPINEPLYVGKLIFENWEQPIPGVRFPLPNKFVPYVAARKRAAVVDEVEDRPKIGSAAAENKDGRLEVFWRGDDGQLWHTWQKAPGAEWTKIVQLRVGGASDIGAAQNHDGRLEVFWRGDDGQLWHAWQESPGGGWSGASKLGVGGASDIGAAQNHDGRLEVFWRGDDGQLWHAWQESSGGGWSGANQLCC